MKKLLILAVALMTLATQVNAQSKVVNDAVKAMMKAKADSENPKKAAASLRVIIFSMDCSFL